jgi:methionyl-tRNA synthetase
VMYNLAEGLRIVSVLISPFMPETSAKMQEQLGVKEANATWQSILSYGGLEAGTVVKKGEALFPRIDLEKEIAELEAIGGRAAGAKKKEQLPEIDMEDFKKLELLTATVKTAEHIKKSGKLLKLTVDVAGAERTIVSGIRQAYTAEEMVGKSVVIVANLKPVKLCGVLSEGMVLAVGEGAQISLVAPERQTPSGERVN